MRMFLRFQRQNKMNEEEKFVVRLYDGFDNIWIDITKPISKDEAKKELNTRTEDGTKNTCFDDIDYYAIFPADTKMIFGLKEE